MNNNIIKIRNNVVIKNDVIVGCLNKEKINWEEILKQYFFEQIKLSENFIRRNYETLDEKHWSLVSHSQTLSENFIQKFQDKVDWDLICEKQTLSEPFIRKFQDKVNWDNISAYQTLSEDFIREFQDKVNWDCISFCQKLSEEFRKEFDHLIVKE